MMTPPRPARRRWRIVLTLALLALLIYFGAIYLLVLRQSQRDETQKADAIVVFGAAEYSGKPSPIFRARLDHGYALYERGLAPMMIVTGGAGGDPQFSEGGVGKEYLITRGVPENRLIAETQSEDTAKSAQRVGTIMRTNGMRSCIAVSDGYHLFRIKRVLEREGVTVYGAPRPQQHDIGRWKRYTLIAREAVSYTLWLMHIT